MIPFPVQLAGTLHAMEVDPRSVWYIGMEANEPWKSGVYKTTDAGRSWNQLPGLKGKAIWSLAIFPANPDIVAAGADDGVYLSEDAGTNWRRISPADNRELRPVVSLAFHPADAKILYAGTTHLPWRTTDGGEHWQSIHSGMLDDSDVFSIVVDAKHPEIVLSSACSGAYRSTAAGTQWSRMPTPHGAFRTYFVALDPSSEAIYAGTTLGLFRSMDAGKTWAKVTGDTVKSIAFQGRRILMASLRGGVLISANGGETVRPVNQGFSNRSLAMVTAAGSVLYATSVYEPGEGGLFRSKDFGATWTHIAAEHGAGNILYLAAQQTNPNVVFAASHDEFFGSKDGGRSWIREISPPGRTTTALVAAEDGSLLAGTNAGLFRKTGAAAWAPVRIAGASRRVQWMESSGHGRLAMVSDGRAYVSENSGKEWKACASGPAGMEFYELSMSAAGSVLAATSHGLLRSADRCATWTLVKEGLEAATVTAVLFHPTRSGEAYTSQYGKILRSLDAGQHWEPLDDRGRNGLYPARLLISPGLPDRLLAMFPRRGIEIAPIVVNGEDSPQKERE
ncbi:MAG TPA: YCF48-related protein [Bryobacteraceae bacterium]|nr:YCF48-related protein [Bryobacteraceae bacterium]